MGLIQNDIDLRNLMMGKAEEAISAVTEEVLDRFKRDFIERYVYHSHAPNKVYKPTYEFENAWEWSAIVRSATSLSTELFYNPDKMSTFDADNFIHGSRFSSPNDVRGTLMDILNKVGYSSGLWISVYRPFAYWTHFIEFMMRGGELERIITKHFSNAGFTKI